VKRETHTAEGKIKAVSRRADDSEERLQLALAMLSPREVLNPQKMQAALRELADRSPPVVIKSYTGDLEAFRTCVELGNVLSVIPNVTLGCGQEPLPPGPALLAVDGIEMHSGGEISLLELRLLSLLRTDGGLGVFADIGALGGSEYDSERLEIMVGIKSPFSQARIKWVEQQLKRSNQQPTSK